MVYAWFSFRGYSPIVFVPGSMNPHVTALYCRLRACRSFPVIIQEGLSYNKIVHQAICWNTLRSSFWHGNPRHEVAFPLTRRQPNTEPRGLSAQKIHNAGRQLESVDNFKEAICVACDNIELSVLQNMVLSKPRRLLAMIDRRADVTTY